MSKNMILDKLEGVLERFQEVERNLTEPGIVSNQEKYVKLNKEYKGLQPLIAAFKEYKNVIDNINSSKELLKEEDDTEMRQMAKEEIDTLIQERDG